MCLSENPPKPRPHPIEVPRREMFREIRVKNSFPFLAEKHSVPIDRPFHGEGRTSAVMLPLDADELCAVIARLAQTTGPSLGEAPRMEFLHKMLRDEGIACQTDAAGNLWAVLADGPWSDTVVYDAHVDVVGQGVAQSIERTGDRLIGAGVADDLLAVGMLVMLARAVHGGRIRCRRPLRLLFSVGEEGLGNLKGMRQAVADHPEPPRALVAFDGSLDEFSIAGLGSIRYRVDVSGPGGHSWNDHGRPNAVEELAGLIVALKEAIHGLNHGQGRVTFNAGTISGGEGVNMIARHAEAVFEIRALEQRLFSPLQVLLEQAAEMLREKGLGVGVHLIGERPAGARRDEGELASLARAVWAEEDLELHETVRSTNINAALAHGWPSICLGLCRSGHAHRQDEFVWLDSMELGWRLLSRLTERLAG